MSKAFRTSRELPLLLAAIALIVLGGASQAHAQNSGPSAMGGSIIRDDLVEGRTTLSFTAVTLPDGTVTGQAEYHFVLDNPFFPEDTRLHIEINCLNIGPDGKTATLSGVVKNASTQEAVGATAIFRVRDNGEGGNAQPDGITPVFLSVPELNRNCNVLTGIQPAPITGGNVQVKP